MAGLLLFKGKVTGLSGRASGYGAFSIDGAESPPHADRSGAAPTPRVTQKAPRSRSLRANCGRGPVRLLAGSAGSKSIPTLSAAKRCNPDLAGEIMLTDCSA